MSPISKLTAEQEDKLTEHRDKWLRIGLCTERVDQKRAIDISGEIYKLLGKKKPLATILLPSPRAAWFGAMILSGEPDKVGQQVEQQVWQQVGQQVWKQVEQQVGQQVEQQVWQQVGHFVWPYLDGHYWSYYVGWATYYRDILGLEMPDGLRVLEAQSELGPLYPLDNFCVVSDRPTAIHMRSGMLHRDGGPAWEYSDGLMGWALNGVSVTKQLAETPSEKLDPGMLLAEKNAEIRREIVRKIGMERIMLKLGAKSLDKKGDYELLEFDIGDGRKRPYLKMRNPSIHTWHVEGVPLETKTVAEALTFRKPEAQKKIPLAENGEEWYQQGDVVIWPEGAKFLRPNPTIIT